MASGIVIIDKPADWTSMDVCAKLRGILKERRVGHGGTLDPMATGVLPVFVGSATRAVEFAEKSGKTYVAGLRLGLVTNTQDTTGETLEERPVTAGLRELEEVLPRFTGPIEQVPPMFSAIKIKGQKLYELARAGKEVERKPRPVTIHALEVLEQTGEADYRLLVRCSKGTYVRTLCHDIGAALGCGGCMSSLRRTEAAGFTIEQAVTIEEVQAQGEALLLPVDRFFAQYPAFRLTEERLERLCRNGNPLPAGDAAPGTYRVYAPGGTFLCLSRWERGQLVSVKNFFGGKQAIITP
ncbi:MAG: tRNA pseudouridine(55) synthase TruB [Oscillospiraceae bacterium]|jgi:tRNA pseudouridine55 synthase|nr:tRNA pseudouridine(55) synthase TruB [Oscillospiraceae bacterium]